MRDEETGAIVMVQKRIMMVCPRELHNFMLKVFRTQRKRIKYSFPKTEYESY